MTTLFCLYLLLYGCAFLPRKAGYAASLLALLLVGWGGGWIYPVVALATLGASGASACLLSRWLSGGKRGMAVTLLCLLFYGGGTFYLFVNNYAMQERLLIEADRHVRRQSWEQVLACARRFRRESWLMDYFRNMALYHLGRLPEELLRYPQSFGMQSLYLPWTGDARMSRYGHYLYEQLGYINEAQRWATEALVVYGETAPVLQDLIRYNIANGRREVAMRFIRRLKSSLFYSAEAEAYERMLAAGEVPGLHPFPEEAGRHHFTNVRNLLPELQFICRTDSTNRMALVYLQCCRILDGKRQETREIIENSKKGQL